MPTALPTHRIVNGISYCNHPDHRNRTRGKSQWIISEPLERDVFKNALTNRWLLDSVGWGLYTPDGSVVYLGLAQDHVRQVFIAKFIDGEKKSIWHGYPVDHQRNTSDIPTPDILKRWMDEGLLSNAKIRKISKGQPCSL